jgi:hypothetical protein
MTRAIVAEFAKLRRARFVIWLFVTVVIVIGTGAAVFLVLKHPDVARRIGFLDPKAPNPFLLPTWKAIFSTNAASISASWGLLVYGFATAFVFAREFSDGTMKNTLTLPIRREYVVLAKMFVLTVCVAALALLAVVLNVGMAAALGLDGFSWRALAEGSAQMLGASLLIYLTLPVIALVAMLGKGFLPPILTSMFGWVLATTFGMSGWAKYFPWSIPITFTGTIWAPATKVGIAPISWAILVAMFVAGILAMLLYIDRADNTQ